jgi:exodeoxyribonuclease VII small subunit
MTKNKEIDLSNMKFENAMKRLEEIVSDLSSGKANLEDMVALYKEGNLLKDFCSKKIAEAKMEVTNILDEEK